MGKPGAVQINTSPRHEGLLCVLYMVTMLAEGHGEAQGEDLQMKRLRWLIILPLVTSQFDSLSRSVTAEESISPTPLRPNPSHVIQVQKALAELGFFTGEPTGNVDARTSEAIAAYERSVGLPPTGAWRDALESHFYRGRPLSGVPSPMRRSVSVPAEFDRPANLFQTSFERVELRGRARPPARNELCADTVPLDVLLAETVPAALVADRAAMRIAALGSAIQVQCAGQRPEASDCLKRQGGSPLNCPISSQLDVQVFWQGQQVGQIMASAATHWIVTIEPWPADVRRLSDARVTPTSQPPTLSTSLSQAKSDARQKRKIMVKDVQLVSATGKGCVAVRDARDQERLAAVGQAIGEDFERMEQGRNAADRDKLPPPPARATFSLFLAQCQAGETGSGMQLPSQMLKALGNGGEVTPSVFARMLTANMQHIDQLGDRYDILLDQKGARFQLERGARCIGAVDGEGIVVAPCLTEPSRWMVLGVEGAPIDRYGAVRLQRGTAGCLTTMDNGGLAIASCREPAATDAAAQFWYARGRDNCFYTSLTTIRPLYLATGATRMVCE